MTDWWHGLSLADQCFYMGAAFFTLFFVVQLVTTLLGLSGEGPEADVDIDWTPRSMWTSATPGSRCSPSAS